MRLTLTPIRGLPGQPETSIAVHGGTLHYDAKSYNLSGIPEGGAAEASSDTPFVGRIYNRNGVLEATVRVVLGDTAAADQPDSPWVVECEDGAVLIPAARLPQPTPEDV